MILISAISMGVALCVLGYERSRTLNLLELVRVMALEITLGEMPFVVMYSVIKRSGGWLVYTVLVTPVFFLTGVCVASYLLSQWYGERGTGLSMARDFIWMNALLVMIFSLFFTGDKRSEASPVE